MPYGWPSGRSLTRSNLAMAHLISSASAAPCRDVNTGRVPKGCTFIQYQATVHVFMKARHSCVRRAHQETSQLAPDTAPRLLADPQLHPPDAVRAAPHCLEPGRRGNVKAWSPVESWLRPRLDAAPARLQAPLPRSAVEEGRSRTNDRLASACGSIGGAVARESARRQLRYMVVETVRRTATVRDAGPAAQDGHLLGACRR